MNKKEVDSQIYQRDYYLKAFDGRVEKYLNSLPSGAQDNRFKEVFRIAKLKEGEKVLDIGCGRGELIYFSLLKGASKAVGIDYSQAALSIARKTLDVLPEKLREHGNFLYQNISSLKLKDKFDCCFLTDIIEHLTKEQLYKLFSQIKKYLSSEGRIVIHTAPNINWVRFEYPLKRFLIIPSTITKRLTRKKPYVSPPNVNFFKKILSYLDLCYMRDYYSYSPHMHINEQSPASLKKLLKMFDFDFRVWCEDGSSNIISIMCKRFWGPDIWALVRLRR